MFRRSTLLVLLAAGAFTACPKPVVTPPLPEVPPPPPPVRIPEGCEVSQAGQYRHSQNASFRYRADDDGGFLQLLVERPTLDGGFAAEDGGATISLTRTPNGFLGSTEATVFTPRGARCPVSFPTEVVGCPDGGLVLRAAVTASVDDNCQLPKKVAPAPKLEHLLVRVSNEEPAPRVIDAGVPVIGAPVFVDAGVAVDLDAGAADAGLTSVPVDAGHPPAQKVALDGGTRTPRRVSADGGTPAPRKRATDAGS